MPEPVTNYASEEENRKQAALLAQAAIERAKGQRQTLAREWSEAKQLWDRRSISETFDPEDIKHVPEPFNRVETITPRIVQGIFGAGIWFTAKAKLKEFEDDEGDVRDVILTQAENDDGRFYSDQEDGIRQMAIFGTVIFKDDWRIQEMELAERPITVKQIKDAEGNLISEEEERGELRIVERTRAYPRTRPLKIENVFLDRFVDNASEMRYIGDLFEITVAELDERKKNGRYVNTDDVRKDSGKEPPPGTQPKIVNSGGPQLPEDIQFIRLYEIWTSMPLGGKQTNVTITIGVELTANVVVSITKNTFPGGATPYHIGRYIKRPHEMYGVGAIIPIRDSSRDLDDWRTLSMRAAELAIAPPFVATDMAELEGEDLHLWPGRVITSPIRGGIEPVPTNFSQFSTQSVENRIRGDIAQTSRAPDAWAGASEAGAETAFEVGKRLQESGLSLGRIIARYRNEVLKSILRNWLALNNMYLEEKVRVRMLGARAFQGQTFREVDPLNLQGQFDFEILDVAEIALLGETTMQWIGIIRALPEEAQARMKWDRVIKDILKGLGKDRPDDFVFMEPDDDDLLSTMEEMELIDARREPPMYRELNHLVHDAQHRIFVATPQYANWTPQKKAMFAKHRNQHQTEIARRADRNLGPAADVALGGQAPAAQPGQGAAGPRGRAPTARPETGTTLIQRQTQNRGQ